MVKISLIRPIYKALAYDPEVQEPLGIETLAGFLRASGHEVQVLDPMLCGQTERYICRQIAAFHPDVVGFSLMSAGDLNSTSNLIRQITGYDPAIRFVVGGNLVSTEPDTVLKDLPPGIICIKYEGELPWLEIVDAIEGIRPFTSIGSAVLKVPDGSFIESPILPPIEDLDSLPFAYRPFLDSISSNDLAVNIQGSRGCVGTCVYCCAPGFPRTTHGRRRDRSPENIIAEIQSIVEIQPASVFNFVDDDFIGPDEGASERVRQLERGINKRGLKISFGIQARPSTLDEESIRLLASAGLSSVFFGFETDDTETITHWGRRPAAIPVSKLVRNLAKYDIETQAGTIMFHPRSDLKSVRRLSTLLRENHLLNYRTATNRLVALPGSAMYRELERQGGMEGHPSGPYPPAFENRTIDAFYDALLFSLGPLRPIWVFAACKLPVIKGKCRLDRPNYLQKYVSLKKALFDLENQISVILFDLLDHFENRSEKDIETSKIREAAFQVAMGTNTLLVKNGFLESEDILRNAVRKDSGI